MFAISSRIHLYLHLLCSSFSFLACSASPISFSTCAIDWVANTSLCMLMMRSVRLLDALLKVNFVNNFCWAWERNTVDVWLRINLLGACLDGAAHHCISGKSALTCRAGTELGVYYVYFRLSDGDIVLVAVPQLWHQFKRRSNLVHRVSE